jgi:hypothetical protein
LLKVLTGIPGGLLRPFPSPLIVAVLLGGAVAAIPACNTGQPAAPNLGDPDRARVPVPPAVYVPKIKNLLVGLPASDDEIAAVKGDPGQLGSLIDGWMARPEYERKMRRFLELTFQQTQIGSADFNNQIFPRFADSNPSTGPRLIQNVEESFARTVLELEKEGRPFTESTTTTRFMMTPALMELYAFIDSWYVDDNGKITDGFAAAHPGVAITAEAAEGPIPIADSLDPSSPRFMHWYDPDVAKNPSVPTAAAPPGQICSGDPLLLPGTGVALHFLLYGVLDVRPDFVHPKCAQYVGTAAAPQMNASDFSSWRMVTVRPPASGEATTTFYDLPHLRGASELVLNVPRIGFFSTPAFFANWPTNQSNQMRVTANQAMIVATGHAFDVGDTTPSAQTPGLDTTHAQADCIGCHRLLDPTRSILSSTYSWAYHQQADPLLAQQKGMFQFDGVVTGVQSIADFGAVLGSHPDFASAWLQKLCFFATSAACDATDPAFSDVLAAYRGAGSSWSAMVRAFYGSPLAYDSPTIAVSRRDHFCTSLDARLGLGDVCGLEPVSASSTPGALATIAAGLPSDGYGRGSVTPALPTQPNLFHRTATENICEGIAAIVVDAPLSARPAGASSWSSADPHGAIADFVQIVMGIVPSDARAAQAKSILERHYAAALTQPGISPTSALRSTFIAACLAPSSVSVGL